MNPDEPDYAVPLHGIATYATTGEDYTPDSFALSDVYVPLSLPLSKPTVDQMTDGLSDDQLQELIEKAKSKLAAIEQVVDSGGERDIAL